jgi:predicted nucleotidyltransferase
MLEILLSSRVRAKLLGVFFTNPGIWYTASGLSRLIDARYNAIWKELVKLESIGILTGTVDGNSKKYSINPSCPIKNELSSIILKTEGLPRLLSKNISSIGLVHKAFIYGSFASGQADNKSDIDLIVIGEVHLEEFSDFIAKREKEIGRPINYVLFSENEWNNKKTANDSFVITVINSPKIMLTGEENAL